MAVVVDEPLVGSVLLPVMLPFVIRPELLPMLSPLVPVAPVAPAGPVAPVAPVAPMAPCPVLVSAGLAVPAVPLPLWA